MREPHISLCQVFTSARMDKLTLVVVLAVVLGYAQARPYYPYYGYHVPWYPVSPCDPYPPAPCTSYLYQNPCGGQPAPPPRPTPCNPQPSGPAHKSPPPYNQQTAEEALLTQDINDIRHTRQGSRLPQGPKRYPQYPQYPRNPEYNTNEYRALKQKPYRRNRIANRRQYQEGEHYGGYGPGMAPAGYRDQPAIRVDYGSDEEYAEYDHGMGQGPYRDAGGYGQHDEDGYGQDDEDDEEDDY